MALDGPVVPELGVKAMMSSGPGATGWANFNRNIDPFVAAGYRVLLINCPGWGQSDPVVCTGSRSDLNAGAVKGVLDALGIGVTAYGVLSRGLLTQSTVAPSGDIRTRFPRFHAEHQAANTRVAETFAALAGEWDKSHRIVQEISDPTACRIHAVLHKIEGDAWNSRYWYARCNVNYEDFKNLNDEFNAIIKSLGA